jgi:hypothetical protein
MMRPALARAIIVCFVSGLITFTPKFAPESFAQEPAPSPKWTQLTLAGGDAYHLAGRDSAVQLVVNASKEDGTAVDATREVQFQAEPVGIVAIDATGYATAQAEGETTVKITGSDGLSTAAKIKVTDLNTDLPINFPNQITPIFTKFGCNGGGCHGKSGGQNGFKLSLLGFEPKEDFEYLVKEVRGRRLFPAAPDRSLVLLKGTGSLPHGGGARIESDSPSYRLIKRWIEQGMPYGADTDPRVTHITVLPTERTLTRGGSQQIAVIAHFSDGKIQDVTRTTQFDSNDGEMAGVSVSGLVSTNQLTGSVAIMARYQGHVGVFRATIPLGIEVANLPPVSNFIDELVFAKLKKLGLPPSGVCDDATFLRRVTVDLCGRLPTLEESEAFLKEPDPNKRNRLVNQLLDSADYAENFANKWSAILRNKRRNDNDKAATFAFHDWIRESMLDNRPYDEFVREVVTATGEPGKNPPAAWYREVKDASAQVEDTAQLFLGLRIQCARCHHHPFEKWSQQDYYGVAAFFSQVGRKRGDRPDSDRIYHRVGAASATNPKTNQGVKPTGLGGPALDIPADADPRIALADWMSDPANPFFSRALVNRYWKHFFSRGLVDPEDDMRVTNPASNPELLDALAKSFIEREYDLKDLIRTICTSTTYQLSAEPNEHNKDDKNNFSRYYPKRLAAESLLDAIDQLTGTTTQFNGVPVGTRAVQLPDNGFNSYFLTVFGKPESSSACECERSGEANLAQSLHLLNSGEIQNKLIATEGRAQKLSGDANRAHELRVRELYLLAFSREPLPEEMNIAIAYINKQKESKRAYEDLVWALMNTKEFLFNH